MTRPALIAVVASSLAALGFAAALAYTSMSADADLGERDVVQRIRIAEPDGHWAREGFVEMVPPVRLPSSSAEAEDVAIWLRIPQGGRIETRWDERRGDWVLVFPPGTVADRVEQRGRGSQRGVADVRGTEIGADGEEWMHTLRPSTARLGGSSGDSPLFGYTWPRSQPDAHARATTRLLAELEALPPATRMRAAARTRYLDGVERKNQCTDCHVHARPDNAVEGEHGLVNRGTDGSGFFTPQTVLRDSIPLERYGGYDFNLADPAVRLACPDGSPVTRERKAQRERAACPGRAVPVAHVDLAAVDGERRERICRARRYLFDHLDAHGRALFSAALAPCSSSFSQVE